MRCGAEVGGKVLRPKLWSETRFAPHAGEVFTVFWRNLELLCSLLEKKLAEETRPTQLAELRKELVILKDEGFRVRLRALEDMYRVLGSASKTPDRAGHTGSAVGAAGEPRAGGGNHQQHEDDAHRVIPSTSELLLLKEKTKLWPVLLKGQYRPPAAEIIGRSVGTE
ncbi:uncharacterized protein LOC122377784 [Amphibalanus amphitrite]|uniref:uncharacterized protein LOC122377784 n=1 Tax=Amphibalanus amphitrite TaxID=1232801 RepID=UPI001C90B34E|nr:uncharacterized protein LOC122377784 [Amphibalanus amphitrite]